MIGGGARVPIGACAVYTGAATEGAGTADTGAIVVIGAPPVEATCCCLPSQPAGFVDPRAADSVNGAAACSATPGTRNFAASPRAG